MRDGRSPIAVFLRASFLAALGALAGCASATRIGDLSREGALDIYLDANARTYRPGQKLVFYVDVFNRTPSVLDLSDLKVELRVLDEGGTILLRQDWTYRWDGPMTLRPEKRITVPIVSRMGLELPVQYLPQATYDVVAVVGGRYASPHYRLQVVRPDLERGVTVR